MDEVATVTDNRKQFSQDVGARSYKRHWFLLSFAEMLEGIKQSRNTKQNNNISYIKVIIDYTCIFLASYNHALFMRTVVVCS
jgi:hypothetical protein